MRHHVMRTPAARATACLPSEAWLQVIGRVYLDSPLSCSPPWPGYRDLPNSTAEAKTNVCFNQADEVSSKDITQRKKK